MVYDVPSTKVLYEKLIGYCVSVDIVNSNGVFPKIIPH